MPQLESKDVFPRFLESATNSSHFLWFMMPVQFYQTEKHQWIYAYLQIGEVTLFPLEPLIPPGSDLAHFDETWSEVKHSINPKITAFVGVYEEFKNRIVQGHEFQVLKVGHEPLIDLKNYSPKGNTSKGVRAARNQAVRLGARVEEWWPSRQPDLRRNFETAIQNWRRKNWVSMEGFLNSSQPLLHHEKRRYFIAYSGQNEIQGFLVATPIRKGLSYFLEDLLIHPSSVRGIGELLVLDALESLGTEGADRASLGVVSLAEIDSTSPHSLPLLVEVLIKAAPTILKRFFNFEGIETFRKRFHPFHWEPTFVCVEMKESHSPTQTWYQVWCAILKAFKIKFDLQPRSLFTRAKALAKSYPLTVGFATIGFVLFAGINHFGEIPEYALRYFSFAPQAWWPEWFYRTLTSDFLFFDIYHFLFCYPLYTYLLYQLEKTQKRRFAIIFVCSVHFFDDFINYFLIIKPFQFLESGVFSRLITFKDVGCSLGMVTVLGFMVNTQLKRSRELFLIVITLALVFGFVFAMPRFTSFVLNLNHFLFFMIGYIVGKIQFELMRNKNRKASKSKSPALQSSTRQ